MRALIQRVSTARLVDIAEPTKVHGQIGNGLAVLVGFGPDEDAKQFERLAHKLTTLRIFSDDDGKMNLSVKDIEGEILVASQFTLFAECRKGTRPSFIGAAPRADASLYYDEFLRVLRSCIATPKVQNGPFGGDLSVEVSNHGPVTLWLDTDDFS